MTYRGQVKNGVVVFQHPVAIPEGSTVDVTLVPGQGPATASQGTLYDSFKHLLGVVDDMPADSSVNIDHYLYGVPKQ